MKKFSAKSIFISITRKIVAVIIFAQLPAILSAVSFSGYTGVAGYLTNAPDKDGETDLRFPMESFLTGQFEFSNFFIVRGEISFRPENVLETGLLNDTDTIFRINEFSGTFRVSTDYFTHFVAGFMGDYESIGSDVFMQRHFGTKPFTSRLTENWRGLTEPYIYQIRKYGFSYVIQPSRNAAGGVYLYTNTIDGVREYSADMRLAFSSRVFKIDLAGGVGVPLSEIGESSDAIFSIKSVNVHYGTNMLLKPSDAFEIFLQHGIKEITYTKEDTSFDDDDVYLLLEPRIYIFDSSKISLSLYQLPFDTVSHSVFLFGLCGVDILFSHSRIAFGSHELETGIHVGAAFSNSIVKDFVDFRTMDKTTDYSLSPFLDMQFGRGTLKTAFSLDVKTDYSWKPNLYSKFMLGFKTSF